MNQKVLIYLILSAGCLAHAKEAQQVQLALRIEVVAKNNRADFRLCQFNQCQAIGNPNGFPVEVLKSILENNPNFSSPVRQMIYEGSSGVNSIFASFTKTIEFEGQLYRTVWCSMKPEISSVLSKAKSSKKEADYIYRIGDFVAAGCGAHGEGSPDVNQVAKELTKVLKQN